MSLTFRNFDDIMYDRFDRNFLNPLFPLPLPLYKRKLSTSFNIDMVETDNNYIIHADLPGLNKDDISISIENSQLIIVADRVINKEKNEDNYHYTERHHGTFSRYISLPENVNTDSLKATYVNGVLEINLNKVGSTGKQIFKID
jgi:HSP20 family protein